MPSITILTENELRQLVKLDLEAVNCVENAFATLATGKVVMPPVLALDIEEFNGEVDVKTAYVQGLDSFAIKMSPGFFDNPKIGLPSTSGLMVVFSSRTGVLQALLLDNGYLTDVRTAAAGAVAAKYLSREDSKRVCIVGAGMQARLQLQSLMLVRDIKHVSIWARDSDKATDLAKRVSDEFNINAQADADLKNSVLTADIIITTTPATSPLVKSDWLQAGQHITAMGSDQPHKNELEPECIPRADLYVADRLSQTRIIGELRSAIDKKLITSEHTFTELGEVIFDKSMGRTSASQITIADLTGTGLQDTAIATLAVRKCNSSSVGTVFEN